MTRRKATPPKTRHAGLTGKALELAELGIGLGQQIDLAQAGQDLDVVLAQARLGELPGTLEQQAKPDPKLAARTPKGVRRKLSGMLYRSDVEGLAAALATLGEDEFVRAVADTPWNPKPLRRHADAAVLPAPGVARALRLAANMKEGQA